MDTLTYTVNGITCAHCKAAIAEEVELVGGVDSVEVDIASKLVVVRGAGLSDDAVRAAIAEAGYEAA